RIPGVRDAATGEAVAAEVRRIFGFPFDLSGFYRLAKSDPVLAGLVEPLYGMRPTLAPTPLEMLVGSISAQQVNLQFAFACRARLVRRYGTPVRVGRDMVWAFPDPAGDLAARRACEHFYGRGRTLSEDAIRRRARAWGEYQNLAIHYLLAGMRLARRVAGGGA